MFWTLVFSYVFYIAIIQLLPDTRDAIRAWLKTKAWPVAHKWLGLWLMSKLFQKVLRKDTYHNLRDLLAVSFWYLLFLGPMSIFVLQIAFSFVAATFTIAQKFSKPTAVDIKARFTCTLNNKAEDQMDFGQVLAMLLLLQPVLAAWEIYMGKRTQPPHFSTCMSGTHM
jgi:hypothetical protein